MRVILPIVVDTNEKRIAEMVGSMPDKFECEPAVFYSIDNIRPYMNFKNLCMVSSGGEDFIVGLSMEEVDDIIMDDFTFTFSAN